jgi:hypothetical protein
VTRWTLVPLAVLTFSAAAFAEPTKEQCLDANQKAQELRRSGAFHSARAQLAICGDAACSTLLRDDCTKRLADIAAVQPSIAFFAKDGAGNDVDTVKVSVDGAPLTDKLTGGALEVDPGDHIFRFEGPGGVVTERWLVIQEGEKGRNETVVLQPSRTEAAAAPAGSTQRTVAIVVGGVGVAGIVAGSIFGLVALSSKPEGCNSMGVCPYTDASNISALKGEEAVADVSFFVGGLCLLSGGVLLATASSGHETAWVAPWIGPGSAGVKGRF